MALTMEAVEKQFRDLGKEALLKKKELAFLPEILRDEEKILFASQCFAEGGEMLLLATSERLLFLHKSSKVLKRSEYEYKSIRSVSCKLGLLLAKVILFSGDKEIIIDGLGKADASEITSLISRQLPSNDDSPSTQHSTPQQEASLHSSTASSSGLKKKGGGFKKILLVAVGIVAVLAIMGSIGGEKNPDILLNEGENLLFEKKDGQLSFGYKEIEREDTSIAGRKRMYVRIQAPRDLLVAKDDDLKSITRLLREDIDKNIQALSLFIHFPPRKDGMGDIIIHFAKDKKGFSGNEDWEWQISKNTEALDALEELKKKEM